MTLHASYISSYYAYHKSLRGFEPTVMTGADCKAIKNIRLRIEKILTEKTDENSLAIWDKILTELPKVDTWLSQQPLQVIASRFDQLIFKIKNNDASSKAQLESERINGYLAGKYANT